MKRNLPYGKMEISLKC